MKETATRSFDPPGKPVALPTSGVATKDRPRRLRLGIIGAGGRGHLGLHAHQPDEGAEVVALCDTDLEALNRVGPELAPDCLRTPDYRTLLQRTDLDAVFVCSPDYLHHEHGMAVLSSGKGLFLEKPMAITVADCDALLAQAEASRQPFYIGHNMRFFPVMQRMKQIIADGTIGDVQSIWCRHFISYGGDAYFKDWHSERQYTTSLLLQKGAHDIDLIHWFAGAYTQRVTAMGKLSVYNQVAERRDPEQRGVAKWNRNNWPPLTQTELSPRIDVEDHSMVLLQLANGVQASYQQCHYTPDDHRNFTVIGTKGRIENCGDHSTGDHWATVRLWTFRCGYQEEGTESIRVPSITGSHGGADPKVVKDFLDYLRTGHRNGATPLDARMSVAAGYFATRSIREGNMPQDIPPPATA
jgi:predicted dehydrogenase